MQFSPTQTFEIEDEQGRITRYLEDRVYEADNPALLQMVRQWQERGLVKVPDTANTPFHPQANRARAKGFMKIKE